MYFVIKAVLRSLVLPPAGPLLLAILGAWSMGRGRRWGAPLLWLGVASLWSLSVPVVADALSHLAERCPPLDLSQPTGAQAVVIIGGGSNRPFAPEYGAGAAGFLLLERLSYGAYVAKRTNLPVLVSGAPDETPVMQTSLARDFGLRIRWLEHHSRDTFENARFSAPILRGAGIRRIILVTSSTHEWRAMQEFRDAGFEVVPAPAGSWAPRQNDALRWVPAPAALERSNLALYELLGERARRVQAALGIRERLDGGVTPVG